MNLNALWESALADAEIQREKAWLFVLAGEPESGWGSAQWLKPGTDAFHEDRDAIDPEPARGRESGGHRGGGGHRVLVWEKAPEVPLAGQLRHELEHARQWDAAGEDGWQLDWMRGATGSALGQAHGGGLIYNLFPSEIAANSAAAEHVRATYPTEQIEEWVEHERHSALFRAVRAPEPLEPYARHTLGFASFWAREFVDAAVRTDTNSAISSVPRRGRSTSGPP